MLMFTIISELILHFPCLYIMRDQHALSGLYPCLAAAGPASELAPLNYVCMLSVIVSHIFFIAQRVPIICECPPPPSFFSLSLL